MFVTGSWDNWATPVKLTSNGDVYSGSLTLCSDSVYEYKFKNGDIWEDFSGSCTTGNTNNRYLTVPANNTTLSLVCFNRCDACPPSYTISTNSLPDYAGAVTGAGNYIEGETVTLVADAFTDFVFTGWTINGDLVSEEVIYEFIATKNLSITANFELSVPMVNITFQVDMKNHTTLADSIFVRGSWDNWENPVLLTENNLIYSAEVQFEAGVTTEYKFMNGTEYESFDGDCIEQVNGNRIFSGSVTDSILPVVCFNSCSSCLEMYTVNLIANSSEMGTISGDGLYADGSEVNISASATEGYSFVNWSIGDSIVSYNADYNFLVTGNVTLSAKFEKIIPTVQVTFNVDMQNELVSDSGVYINGNWNNWNLPVAMTIDHDQVYSVTLNLPENMKYEYKFVNGGGFEWENYETPSGSQVNIVTGNREIIVQDQNLSVATVCYNSSVACSTNNPPVAFDHTYTVEEDSLIGFLLQAYDAEDEISDLQFNIVTQPSQSAEFTVVGREITYQPKADYFGTDSFAYTVTDSELNESEIAVINISVTPVNDRPIAESYSIDANNNTSIEINLNGHISDIETPETDLNITFVPTLSSVLGGSIVNQGSLAFTYTVSNPDTHEDYIVYRVSDGELSSFAEVVTVSNLNNNKSIDLATASNGIVTIDDEAWVKYGQSIDLEFIGIDRAYPFEQLEMSIIKQPEHGKLSNFNSNEYGGSVLTTYLGKYLPTENSNETDSIVFSVFDGNESVQGTFYIHVSSVKMSPDLLPIAEQTMNENDTLILNMPVSDKDSQLSELNWDIKAIPNVSLSFEVKIVNDTAVASIIPPVNFSGNLVLETKVTDPDMLSDTEMFNLKIVNKNNAPEMRFETTFVAYEDSTFSYLLKAEDYDKDSLSFTLTGLPEWMSSRMVSKYTMEIYGMPTNSDVGTGQIIVAITDRIDTLTETVNFEVINTNDLPYLISAFDTIFGQAGADPLLMNLESYFADEDADASFVYSVLQNTNPEIIQATISGSELQIEFNSEKLGTSEITLNAISQGDTVRVVIPVVVDTKVGINDQNIKTEFVVYPNPATDHFVVRFHDGCEQWKLQILDITGKEIFRKNLLNQNELEISTDIFNATGAYLIRVISEQNSKTSKLIIN